MKALKIVLLLASCLIFSGCKSVSMSDRGLSRLDVIPGTCDAAGIEWLDRKILNSHVGRDDYSSNKVANEFALFAVASENAYAEVLDDGVLAENIPRGSKRGFLVKDYDPRWQLLQRLHFENGLSFDVYYKEEDAELPASAMMLAIRGTNEGADDWIYGNIPWIASLFSQETQFETLRKEFQKIVVSKGKGQKRPYVFATGHSLGGALARHLAEAYPCTSAVVFDASPITLETTLTPRMLGGLVIDIVERDDELRVATNWLADFSRDNDYVKFRLNPVSAGNFQHSETGFAVALPRYVLDCRARGGSCEIKDSDPGVARARAVYCGNPKNSDIKKSYGVNDLVCR